MDDAENELTNHTRTISVGHSHVKSLEYEFLKKVLMRLNFSLKSVYLFCYLVI